jgi:peptidoglycan hydrolase-like protein with peptidoglycan-binding domain
VPFNRVVSGGIALAVGCLLVFSAPAAAGPKVAAVQVALKRLGLYSATVDGVRGPRTKEAIVRFQRRKGLVVDGIVGPQTRRAFGKRGRPAFGSRTMKRGDRGWDVAAMQYILARRGFPPGAIDAVFGLMTERALRGFQRAYGLPGKGRAGRRTIAAMRRKSPARRVITGPTPEVRLGDLRLLRPVPGPIGDRFGAPRSRKRSHTGIDFPVPFGTRIGAAAAGVTEFAGRNTGGYGKLVVVRHGLGVTTWYAHMSSISTSEGEHVSRGELLGFVGSTGHSTGPHLHFELRRDSVPIDPEPYLLRAVATSTAGTGGGVAARACPIREPLVRYTNAQLDACKTSNLNPAR